jgi:hypothetical protein
MRFNFKKIAAIGTSLLLTGMSMGLAAATSYPNEFSASNTAIVYGANANPTDLTEATSIQTSLGTSGIVANLTGAIPLDHGTTSKVYLNTSLTTAWTTYTKADLPTVLADGTFSGSPSSTYAQQITFITGTNAGGDNSGNVEFSRQPTSSYDPSVGVSMGSSTSNPIYNATVTFNTAVNFSSTNSQGQTLTLFGKPYVVSSDSSDSAGLILFQSAQTITLTQGGTSAAGSDTQTVPVNGIPHTIKLLNGGSSSATISVDGTSQSINSGSSRQINGVSIAVTSVQSSTAGGNTAVVLVGSNKLTFKNGQQVTQGDNNKAILGTYAYLSSVNASTGLTVAVYGQDYHTWWIGNGQSFVDPVFGSFGVSNSGLTSEITDTTRDALKIGTSGVGTLTLSFTDHNSNKATFDWATNKSGGFNLTTSTGYFIYPYEMANLTANAYTLTGTGSNNQYVGHLLQLQTVYNDTSTSTADYVTFYDPISGNTFTTGTPSAEGTAPLNIDGRQYTVTYLAAPGTNTGSARIKFPTTDSVATTGFVVYPTILGNNGESVQLYAPLNLTLAKFDGTNDVGTLYLPNGNGYNSITFTNNAGNATLANWTLAAGTGVTLSGTTLYSGPAGGFANAVNASFGQMRYTITGQLTGNRTLFQMWMPGKGLVNEPALVIYEGKDSGNLYNAVLIDAKNAPAGTSSDGAGIAGVYFTSTTGYPTNGGTSGVQLYSNSNLQQYVDGYGTFVQKDATSSAQPIATVFYSAMQAYEQLYLGAVGTSSTVTGAIPVRDSDVASVSTKNLIVVGGSCVNTVAARLLGVPAGTCGAAWTSATTPFVTGGLGSGQFLIKSYAGANTNGLTSGTALLVAGTDATDTINAATYLTNVKPDVATGKAWTGTSVSSATQVLTSA